MNFLIFLLFLIKYIQNCPLKCSCTQNYINCTNFETFKELNFKSLKAETYETIELRPSKKIILDQSLNLSCLTISKQVVLYNIQGFSSNPFKGFKKLELKLYNSYFEFYGACKYEDFGESLFESFSKLTLGDDVEYKTDLCPLVFSNVSIDQITAFSLNSTNKLSFKKFELKSTPRINQLFLYNVNLGILNDDFLDSNVLQGLKTIQLFGKINSVDQNAFARFPQLRYLSFELFNFNEFTKNLTWLSTLPKNLVLNFNDRSQQFGFEDKDFCLFKSYPQDRQIVPILKGKIFNECTCTMVWLIKNSIDNNLIKTQTIDKCLMDKQTFKSKITECNFDFKVKECNVPATTAREGFELTNELRTSPLTPEVGTKTNSVIKSMVILIGSVGFVTISAIMGLFLFITR